MTISRIFGLFYLTVLLTLSGCSAVSQPVYKVPEGNVCSDKGIKDKTCAKFDGIPYVLPQTKLKVSIPVTTTINTEGGFVSEARNEFMSDFKTKNKCTWDKEKGKEDCNKILGKEFFLGNCTWDKEEGKEDCNKILEEKFSFEKLLKGDACTKLVFEEADKFGVKVTINDPYGKPEKSYKLGDVSIASEAEPDPGQLYYVEVKGGLFERRSIDVTFAAGGILNEITSSKEDKTAEFAAKTFGSILGAAAKYGSYTERVSSNAEKAACDNSIYKNTVYRALDTFKSLKDYRSDRKDALMGNNNAGQNTKDNLELRLKELDASRDAALAMFGGGDKEKTKTYEVTLLPHKIDDNIPMATFSESCGIYRTGIANANLPSISIPMGKDDDCKDESKIIIHAVFSPPPHLKDSSLPARISESLDSGTNTRGIYYRVPEIARITINGGNEELVVKDVPVAQLGKVASLPAQTGSSNVTYKVTLDPVTGMLLKVAITSESMNTGIAKDFIDPVGDYLKARKDSNDELSKLQQEEARLKAKLSIKELNEKLGQ